MTIKLSGTLSTLVSNPSNDFAASFTESNGQQHRFTFNALPDQPSFTAKVELTCESLSLLNGTRFISGIVGTDKVNLTLGNGPTITGTLNVSIQEASSISGNGQWTST